MRFIPEKSILRFSSSLGSSTTTLSGRWPLENEALELALIEERTEDIPEYRCTVAPRRPVYIDRITLTGRIEGTLRPVALLKEGYQSWSFSGILAPEEHQQRPRAAFVVANQEAVWNPPTGRAGQHTADTLALLDDGLNPSLLIAQLPPFSDYVAVEVASGRQPVRISISWIVQRELGPGELLETSPVAVSAGVPEELLSAWSRTAANRAGVHFGEEARPPRGWCSWYHYFTAVTPEKLRANLATAAREKLPLEVFQIDDGWQRRVGEWTETAPGFRDQMGPLAAEIREAGFTPGLWLAPFIVSKDSSAFREEGWVLRSERGKPVAAGFNPAWKGTYYALDLTHPEVIARLRSVVRTATEEWGYGYLKLDFLYAASLPGRRHDMRRSPAQVLRDALEIIREAAGPRTTIMGCGVPLTAGIGLLDAARVSCDVAPRWGQSRRDRLLRSDSNIETRGAIRNTVLRSHMNKRFWHNDPDCLMLRSRDTGLTETERETHRTAVLQAGGSLFISDDLTAYSEQEMELLRTTLTEADELAGGGTLPLRLFDDPGVYALYNDRGYVTIFNLNDAETTVELRLARYRELLDPHTGYRPFEGAESHPLEAPRQVTVPGRGFKKIRLSR